LAAAFHRYRDAARYFTESIGWRRWPRTIAFLKRFTVFNIDQCDNLPETMTSIPVLPDPVLAIAEADRVIAASGADFRIGGSEAYYSSSLDFVQVPPQAAFHDPVNWYRTALHELRGCVITPW
jgi:antirestriction protein ArdC